MPSTLIVGLGNPGPKYVKNRHNVGFMALDLWAEREGFPLFRKWENAMVTEGNIAGYPLILFKPQTYMNLSGTAVNLYAHFYKIPLSRIWVVHDDLDLTLGRIRVKTGGGHGGHNGLKSLDAHLGKDYGRIRIGIGHPGDKSFVSDYVLQNFTSMEHKVISSLLEIMENKLPLLLEGKATDFASQVMTETSKTYDT